MAAFVSLHAWHSVTGRQFAPSWTVCTNPPFSPTAAPYPVTIILIPTRTDTKKRHWQQPLVTRVYKMVFKEVLKWMPDCGYTERTVLVIAVLYTQLPRLENLPGSSIHRKSHRKVVFSFSEQEITRRKKWSQEDPFFAGSISMGFMMFLVMNPSLECIYRRKKSPCVTKWLWLATSRLTQHSATWFNIRFLFLHFISPSDAEAKTMPIISKLDTNFASTRDMGYLKKHWFLLITSVLTFSVTGTS